jgi:FdhD protein
MRIGDYTEYLILGFLRNHGMLLASRSGFTAWGVEIAQQAGPTLTGCQLGQPFGCLFDKERLIFHVDISSISDDACQHRRKSGSDD